MQIVPSPRPTSLPRPSNAELAGRQARALAGAMALGAAGLVVWGRGSTNVDGCANLLYLTNHLSAVSHIPDDAMQSARGHAALVLAPGRDPVLLTDSYDIDLDEVAAVEIRVSVAVDADLPGVIGQLGLGGARLGLAGMDGLLQSAYATISAGLPLGTRLVPMDAVLTELRLIKSPHEIALLREASRIGCDWMRATLAASVPGRTEGEVVGEGLRHLAAAGGWPYDVAISAGPASARYRHHQRLPTWDTMRPLQRGDLLHVDLWGPAAHGYFCDLVRSTVVGGVPDARQERLLDDAIGFVAHVVEGIVPGVPLSSLHARGQDYQARRGGAASAFSKRIPFVGHSLGLECEAPFITARAGRLIAPGMVLAIECHFADDTAEGAGFEQVVLVGEAANEVLTASAPTRAWLEV